MIILVKTVPICMAAIAKSVSLGILVIVEQYLGSFECFKVHYLDDKVMRLGTHNMLRYSAVDLCC